MDTITDYIKDSQQYFLNPTYAGFEKAKQFYNDPNLTWEEYLDDLEYCRKAMREQNMQMWQEL